MSSPKQLYRIARRALVRIGVKPGIWILDFGARVGNYSIPAAELVTETGKVYALDKDRGSLDELMSNSRHLPQLVRIDTDGGPTIPLTTNSIDVILLFDVLLREPMPYLVEFHRILNPEGILAIYLPIGHRKLIAHTEKASFRLVDKLMQDMVHWDRVEQGTVYLFNPSAN